MVVFIVLMNKNSFLSSPMFYVLLITWFQTEIHLDPSLSSSSATSSTKAAKESPREMSMNLANSLGLRCFLIHLLDCFFLNFGFWSLN